MKRRSSGWQPANWSVDSDRAEEKGTTKPKDKKKEAKWSQDWLLLVGSELVVGYHERGRHGNGA